MLGDSLKKLRGKRTQEEVAKALGMSRARYSHYENNVRQPDYETLQQLANFFNVSIDYLLGREENSEHIEKKEKFFKKNKECILLIDSNLPELENHRNSILELIKSTDPELKKISEQAKVLLSSMDDVIEAVEEVKKVLQGYSKNSIELDNNDSDKE